MLKTIPPILSPDLLYLIACMGHGDELVLADANFPAHSMNTRVVQADGHGIPQLLTALLQFLPLDQYAEHPAFLMEKVKGDTVETPVWEEYRRIVREAEPGFIDFKRLERFAFYERAREAFAIVASGERALYGNIILKKGVVAAPG